MRKHPALQQLGNRIRQLRLEAGFSQEDFAAEADFDRTYYGGVERGERNISALNLLQLAKTLRLEVGDLFPKLSEIEREMPSTKLSRAARQSKKN